MAGFRFQKLQTSIEYAFYADFNLSELIFVLFYPCARKQLCYYLAHLQLKKMTTDIHLIVDALASSSLLEVQVVIFISTVIFLIPCLSLTLGLSDASSCILPGR